MKYTKQVSEQHQATRVVLVETQVDNVATPLKIAGQSVKYLPQQHGMESGDSNNSNSSNNNHDIENVVVMSD